MRLGTVALLSNQLLAAEGGRMQNVVAYRPREALAGGPFNAALVSQHGALLRLEDLDDAQFERCVTLPLHPKYIAKYRRSRRK